MFNEVYEITKSDNVIKFKTTDLKLVGNQINRQIKPANEIAEGKEVDHSSYKFNLELNGTNYTGCFITQVVLLGAEYAVSLMYDRKEVV